ncbi:hypothetical protein OB919_13630 [Halobacteria archaeon AArc-curdl1]|uniref:Uncharacterized protein n=1 Tax=Natronosalvus hydrolyticus TaxID=2979988 RepID=A0AAP2ZBN1_9EURY|nr:hypothetical protein [Halobacteria archaeon AArc-curdl1]
MAEILILTILAALVGLYSLLPPHKQLRLRYGAGPKTKTLLAALASLIILFSLTDSFLQHNYPEHTLTAGEFYTSTFFLLEAFQIIATLGIVSVFLNLLVLKTPTISNTAYFNEKIRELLNKEDYTTVIELLNDHYDELFHPDNNRYSEILDTVDTGLQRRGIIQEIADYHPDFALRVIEDQHLDTISRKTFVSNYLETLFKNETSILYRELWDTQAMKKGHQYRYNIPENNRLLKALFDDCEIAADLDVYNPIRNVVFDHLREQEKKDYDEYNDFDIKYGPSPDRSTFQDPLVAAVHFYDIMVTEALYQGIDWHMNLYDFDSFTARICRNFETTENTDLTSEFPNKYAYILHEIVWRARRWGECGAEDLDQLDLDLEHTDRRHENTNIVKSTIRCLTKCGRLILSNDEIPEEFKEWVSKDIYCLYFKFVLSDDPEAQRYGVVMADCFEEQMNRRDEGDEFRRVFYRHLTIEDGIMRSNVLYREGGVSELEDLKKQIKPSSTS